MLNGRLPALFPMALWVVIVDDVGEGHVLAGDHGRVGGRCILGEKIVTGMELYGLACRLAGAKLPPTGPLWMARGPAAFGELLSKLGGRPGGSPLRCPAAVRTEV